MDWQAEDLWEQLVTLVPRISIEVVPELASTNTTLLERARLGDASPCLLVAERQTAGRGRLGRQWQAAEGRSLTFSLAWPAEWDDWSGLSLVVGLAIAQGLDPTGQHLALKWPNDLWLKGDDRKLGGILIETTTMPDTPDRRLAVIGIGLNIAPRDPTDTTPLASGYACVQEWLPQADAAQVLHWVALPLLKALNTFAQAGFAPFQSAFDARDALAGRTVRAGELEGTALGVDPQGQLLVQTTSCISAVNSGEVQPQVSVRPC
jgi:BirA family biotin operon repressor/biotin-[acetyl-CoA-carboxylase] ligase